MPAPRPSSPEITAQSGRRRVLVVGGTGYVGQQVVLRLLAEPDLEVAATWCHRPPALAGPRWTRLDLTAGQQVREIVRAAGLFDAVIHCGHLVRGPEAELVAVNGDGSARLCEAVLSAAPAAAPRLVALSTASVHGPGPWSLLQADAPLAPASATSRTRAAGDQRVIEVGGAVVRPHLVTCSEDPHFGPQARRLVEQLGWPGHGAARHTVITAARLADGLVRLALSPGMFPTGPVLAGEETLTLRSLLSRAPYGVPGLPSHGVTLEHALSSCPPGVDAERWRHDLAFVGQDHVLDLEPWKRLTRPVESVLATTPP